MKSEKKIYTAADVLALPLKISKERKTKVYSAVEVLFLPLKIGEEQKTEKGLRGRKFSIFTTEIQ